MDQLTDRQPPVAHRIPLRDIYRGPLAIAFATSIASVSGVILLYPVLPVLAADLGVDEARIGLVMAAFTAPAIVLAPLFGILADLHGRRWLLVFGLALFGLAGGAAALAPSYDWVLFRRAIQGIGASALLPLTIVLISDILPDDPRDPRPGHQGRARPRGDDRAAARSAARSRSCRGARRFVPFLLIVLLALAALSLDAGNRSAGPRLAPGISRAHLARDPRAAADARVRDRLPALLPRLRALHLSADHRRAALRRDAGGDRRPDRGVGGGLDHHRDQHRPHLRPLRDRDAARARILCERHRRRPARDGRAAVADRDRRCSCSGSATG